MKNIYLATIFILALFMLTLPLMAKNEAHIPNGTTSLPANTAPVKNEPDNETINVYMSEEKSIRVFSIEDYIFGVVAAEMPALYSEEALKAQAVASYTYAMYKAEQNIAEEYDITDNFHTDQAFITVDAARAKWGEDADKYEERIRNAIKSVKGKKITHNGKLILAAYHAISSGKTENALDIWGGNYEYLTSVESVGDKLSPNYLTTVEFSIEEIKTKFATQIDLNFNPSDYFKDIQRTPGGAVKNISFCGKELSGSSIRATLELRSANFDITFTDDKFVFNVIGYGHGIGLSQYGAHYMAMQGKNYEEILMHYYTGCKIK